MKKTNAIRILDKNKIQYETVPYTYDPDNLDLRIIAKENNLELPSVYKTLMLKGDKNGVCVAVVPGNKTLDLKSIAKESGNKKMQMLAVKDLEKTTGYIRGGCSPIGMKKNFPVYVDAAAKGLKIFYINAGTRGVLLGLSPKELESIINVRFCEIGKE